MSNSSINIEEGEFLLASPTLRIYAPTSLDDQQGEELYEAIEPHIESLLAVFKAKIEGINSIVRVGYEVT